MLKQLCEAFGVAGHEFEVRALIEEAIKPYCDSVRTDNLGNLIAVKRAKSVVNHNYIMLSAHMDEVGFIITKITDDGYLKFDTVGGIDTAILPSQRVKINDTSGIIGVKAIHLTSKSEREQPLKISDLYIDIGAKDAAEAEKCITVGDYAGFVSNYIEFGDNSIKAKALDDRAGCAILIEMLKYDWKFDLYCAFTVQEEVGLRGAKVAATAIKSEVSADSLYALVVEATTCNDLPNVPEHLQVTKLGGGPAISILDSASLANRELMETLKSAAENNDIPYQFKASTKGGNDAGAIGLAGIPVASVSVPCRYIHSPVCTMDKRDFANTQQLVFQFLRKMEEK